MTDDLNQTLLDMMRKHGIAELDFSEGNLQLALRLPVQQTTPSTTNSIKAPHAGLFFTRHPMLPRSPSAPRPARRGTVIGFLKAGALLRPLVAVTDCKLCAARVADGTLVGYGDVLFDIIA